MSWFRTALITMCLVIYGATFSAGEESYGTLSTSPVEDETYDYVAALSDDMLLMGYTYSSIDNFVFEDELIGIGFTNESSNVGMHTFSLAGKSSEGGGFLLSYGFSDPMAEASDNSRGEGAEVMRQEFDLTFYSPRKKAIGAHFGFRYSQLKYSFDEDDLKCHDLGMLLGVGGNHLLHSRFRHVSIYWSAQVYGGIGWKDLPSQSVYIDYGYGYGYWVEVEYPYEWEEPYLTGGASGTAGVQLHLAKYITLGAGYKGQIVHSSNGYGDMDYSYHGYTGSLIIRW